ncbi:MAG: S8 family peptidase [Candidatus Zixiibacteriota bacterium]|nr:MAG: S8 family peptidase [candidate division Zixibacteria bacterium]
MQRWYGNIVTLIVALMLSLSGPDNAAALEVGSDTHHKFADYISGPDSVVSVVVLMEDTSEGEPPDLSYSIIRPTREYLIKNTLRRLQVRRVDGADQVEQFLARHSVAEVKKFWIIPAYSAVVALSDIEMLQSIPGVSRVVPDVELTAFEPVEVSDPVALSTSISTQLQLIEVPGAWARGFTGKGRLVASFDTGVEYTHPALASKWRGNHAPLSASWFSTISPLSPPADKTGHGSHTMGIMVGSTDAETIGVAPDAEWITAGVIDQGRSLSGTVSDIIMAFQWALNPDGDENTTDDVPDVILNSWGIPAGIFAPCDNTFWAVIDNVEAAGIVTVFAAGNEGPTPQSIRNPADRATTTLNSFSVGAVDNLRQIAGFSSRGPTSCDITKIKPEVVGPGVKVRSCTKGGGYIEMSGTSMAAPYIAGLVALAREFDPNATVAEIKWAIIRSAQDLGDNGEDNAYGHGLVNAVLMLDYLAETAGPYYGITETVIESGQAILPGEYNDLRFRLTRVRDTVSLVTGRLESLSAGVTVSNSEAVFLFGTAGTEALSMTPYQIFVDADYVHGEPLVLSLQLSDHLDAPIDTLRVNLTNGYPSPGTIGEHTSGNISISVSDFGQIGFAAGSIYNLDREGFRFNNSENLLYEAGVVIGFDSLTVSSAVRDETGRLRPSDFIPVEDLSTGWLDSVQGFHRRARFTDDGAPYPVTVSQQTIDFAGIDDEGIVIFQYYVVNNGAVPIEGLRLGFLADFDLNNGPEQLVLDYERELIYQLGETGPVIGLLAMRNVTSFNSELNPQVKAGFAPSQLWDMIAADHSNVDDGANGDMLFVVGSDAINLAPFDSAEVTFALVAGATVDELFDNAEQAALRYFVVTNVEEPTGNLPDGFVLHQNYPNPFNPTTTIRLELSRSADVNLEVYNLLGQRIRGVYSGTLGSGLHTFIWDGLNDRGKQVATGVYFYRLETGGSAKTRKMVLLR